MLRLDGAGGRGAAAQRLRRQDHHLSPAGRGGDRQARAVLPGLPHAWTAGVALPGGNFPWDGAPALAAGLEATHPFLAAGDAARLVRLYGTGAARMLDGARTAADLGIDFGAGLGRARARLAARARVGPHRRGRAVAAPSSGSGSGRRRRRASRPSCTARRPTPRSPASAPPRRARRAAYCTTRVVSLGRIVARILRRRWCALDGLAPPPGFDAALKPGEQSFSAHRRKTGKETMRAPRAPYGRKGGPRPKAASPPVEPAPAPRPEKTPRTRRSARGSTATASPTTRNGCGPARAVTRVSVERGDCRSDAVDAALTIGRNRRACICSVHGLCMACASKIRR